METIREMRHNDHDGSMEIDTADGSLVVVRRCENTDTPGCCAVELFHPDDAEKRRRGIEVDPSRDLHLHPLVAVSVAGRLEFDAMDALSEAKGPRARITWEHADGRAELHGTAGDEACKLRYIISRDDEHFDRVDAYRENPDTGEQTHLGSYACPDHAKAACAADAVRRIEADEAGGGVVTRSLPEMVTFLYGQGERVLGEPLESNAGAHVVLNTQPDRANARVRALSPEGYMELLERRAAYGRSVGFTRLLLMEPGARGVTDLWDDGRRVRPLSQFHTLADGHADALARFIDKARMPVDVYTGTYNAEGVDEVPGPTAAYLNEMRGWGSVGVERVYLDWSAWNAETSNLHRGGGGQRQHGGGGARLDGARMLGKTCNRLGVGVSLGVEPFPLPDGAGHPAYAIATAKNVDARMRDGTLGQRMLAATRGAERTVLLRSAEDFDLYGDALVAAAALGASFSVYVLDEALLAEALLAEATALNTVGRAAREAYKGSAKKGGGEA